MNIEEPRFCPACAAGSTDLCIEYFVDDPDPQSTPYGWYVECSECGWNGRIYQDEEAS